MEKIKQYGIILRVPREIITPYPEIPKTCLHWSYLLNIIRDRVDIDLDALLGFPRDTYGITIREDFETGDVYIRIVCRWEVRGLIEVPFGAQFITKAVRL